MNNTDKIIEAVRRAERLRALEHKLANIVNAGLSFNSLDDKDLDVEVMRTFSAVEALIAKVRAKAAAAEAESFRLQCAKNDD